MWLYKNEMSEWSSPSAFLSLFVQTSLLVYDLFTKKQHLWTAFVRLCSTHINIAMWMEQEINIIRHKTSNIIYHKTNSMICMIYTSRNRDIWLVRSVHITHYSGKYHIHVYYIMLLFILIPIQFIKYTINEWERRVVKVILHQLVWLTGA